MTTTGMQWTRFTWAEFDRLAVPVSSTFANLAIVLPYPLHLLFITHLKVHRDFLVSHP